MGEKASERADTNEQSRIDTAGRHKIHVHTYPQRGLQWAKEEEN